MLDEYESFDARVLGNGDFVNSPLSSQVDKKATADRVAFLFAARIMTSASKPTSPFRP